MKISLCPVGTPRPSSSLQPIPPPFPLWACLDPHVLGYSPIHRPCVKAPKAECHLECCWEGSGKQGKCLLRSLGYVLGTVNSSCVLKDVRAVFKHSYLNNPKNLVFLVSVTFCCRGVVCMCLRMITACHHQDTTEDVAVQSVLCHGIIES